MRSSYTGEFNFSKYLEKVNDADTIHYIQLKRGKENPPL